MTSDGLGISALLHWMRERACERRRTPASFAEEGSPVEILDFLKLLKRTGSVNLYACKLAAAWT